MSGSLLGKAVRWLRRPATLRAGALISLVLLVGFLFAVGWLGEKDPEILGLDQIPETAGPSPYRPGSDQARLTWLGHAGYLVQWRGRNLLLDPNLSAVCKIVPRLWDAPRLPEELRIDAVLISHAHYDHLDLPTLDMIPDRPLCLLPRGAEQHLSHPLRRRLAVRPLLADEQVQIGPLTVSAVPAAHQGGRSHPLPCDTKALGYMISDGSETLYFAGDTAVSLNFEELARRYQPDLAILPIGAFSPRFPLRFHHMSPEEAVTAAQRLGVKAVFPCHFGTFRLAFDAPETALPRFARAAHLAGLPWHLPMPDEFSATTHQARWGTHR